MPRSNGRLPGKKDVARALLLKGSVFVHLDPRREGVSVPCEFLKQPQLVLQIGLDLPLPIPDLRVDRTGVHGTLSFQRMPFRCTVPWDAVFAVVGDDGRGMVWPTSMPKEIAVEVERESERQKLIGVEKVAGAERSPSPRATRRRVAARAAEAETTAPPPAKSGGGRHGAEAKDDAGAIGDRASQVHACPGIENAEDFDREWFDREDVVGEPVRPFRVLPSKTPQVSASMHGPRPRLRRVPRALPPYLRVVK